MNVIARKKKEKGIYVSTRQDCNRENESNLASKVFLVISYFIIEYFHFKNKFDEIYVHEIYWCVIFLIADMIFR